MHKIIFENILIKNKIYCLFLYLFLLFCAVNLSSCTKDVVGHITEDSDNSANGDSHQEKKAPVASFEVITADALVGDEVQFKDLSTDGDGSIIEWSWDFGDGNTSDEKDPEHIFQTSGDFTIQLTVMDNDSLESNVSKTITINSTSVTDQISVLWNYPSPYLFVYGGPVVSSDGTLYIGNDGRPDRGIYNILAIKDETDVWKYGVGDVVRADPAIGSDGTLYAGSFDGYLYAFKSDGTLKWKFDLNGHPKYSGPAIADDGTIYVGSTDNNLYAINPDGSKKWSVLTGGDVNCSPAIGSDGSIYVGATDGKLYAVDADGNVKWTANYGSWAGTDPAIGEDGTIYFAGEQNVSGYKGVLVAFNPDGTKKWQKDFPDKISYGGPAIAEDGTVYIGESVNLLRAFSASGDLKWQYHCNGAIEVVPAIDDQGNIYFGDRTGAFYVLTPDGEEKYEPLVLGDDIRTSTAIDNNGIIYVGVNNDDDKTGSIVALKSISKGAASSSWPMKGGDVKHTGNVNN